MSTKMAYTREDARREHVLAGLMSVLEEYYAADKERTLKKMKMNGFSNLQAMNNLLGVESRNVAMGIKQLDNRSTKTLEMILDVAKASSDTSWVSSIVVGEPAWREMTGKRYEAMLMDALTLRKLGVETQPSALLVGCLFESYKAAGLRAGTLHTTGNKKKIALMKAFVSVSWASTVVGDLYESDFIPSKNIFKKLFKRNRDSFPTQLTDEIIHYLQAHPEQGEELASYIREQHLPARLIHLDHFIEKVNAATALNAGVL